VTDNLCVVCEKRPTPDGYGCPGCARKATARLAGIVELAPDARLIAAGLVRRGGGTGGKPESRSPLNEAATDTLGDVQNILTTLARDIAETRGIEQPRSGRRDPVVVAARWLVGQVEWLRHAADGTQPWAPGSYAEIDHCVGRMRGLVNGRSEQRFLGPCGAPTLVDATGIGKEPGSELVEGAPCEGDVYCHLDADLGRCKACGANWSTSERQHWLDGEVREHAFEARHIAEAYGVNVKTIRTWANRGTLRTYWRTEAKLTVEWTDPPIDEQLKDEELAAREAEVAEELAARGPRLHYVGDVLDLAAVDAARRATERAKRARRAAAKAAEEASDAA
jgi:hypothetical protein